MSEVMKDCAIKLFGKTITLLSENRQSSLTTSTSIDSKDESGGESTWTKYDQQESNNPTHEERSTEAAPSSEIDDDTNTVQTPNKQEPKEPNTPEETTLKKPDKILPCPRCNSTDTKFCYYNNYNVNQPRYFCRNCQRYWTSGGTMRNVPVGSGRRKNKTTMVPNFGHIMVSDALQTAQAMNGFLISPNSGFHGGFYPATTYWNVPGPVSCLGKHSRDQDDMVKTSGIQDAERSVLIPKTLRIHDPSEAAKSSIWSTLGIKYEKTGPLSGTGLFKALDSKGDRSIDNRRMVLQTNPAALSRSVNFHESA